MIKLISVDSDPTIMPDGSPAIVSSIPVADYFGVKHSRVVRDMRRHLRYVRQKRERSAAQIKADTAEVAKLAGIFPGIENMPHNFEPKCFVPDEPEHPEQGFWLTWNGLCMLAPPWQTPRANKFAIAIIEAQSAAMDAMQCGQLQYRREELKLLYRKAHAFFALA